MNATGAWQSSRAALPLLRSGQLPWRPEFASEACALSRALADVKSDALAAAVERELTARAEAFLDGIDLYRRHPYRRSLADPPAIWQAGTTRLLDYGAADGAPVLVVPSLINRAYILDLAPQQSLLRYLARRGLRILLLDWGAPGAEERRFGLSDYILRRLVPAIEMVHDEYGSAPLLLGYCMGGLLALAGAHLAPEHVRALALLATPWAFHAERAAHARLLGIVSRGIIASCEAAGVVSVDLLQTLFVAQDPLLAPKKFARFAALDQASAAAQRFVALEDWLNDGIPLALPVARECFGGWYGEDLPGSGQWRVGGQAILPREVDMPALVVVPAHDRIVPPATAAALAEELPQAETLTPRLGHIGMIVSSNAPRSVWAPLAAWLEAQSG